MRTLLALLVVATCVSCETPAERRTAEAEAEAFIAKWRIPEEYGLGHQAPGFHLPVIQGVGTAQDSVRLEDLSSHVVVLNFWSTWCSPCVAEHSDLNRIAEEYAPKGVRFIGIVGLEPPRAVIEAERDRGLKTSYPNLYDHRTKVSREYRALGVPLHVIMDRGGKVVFNNPGGPIDPEAFREVLDRVLAGEGVAAGDRYLQGQSARGQERFEDLLRARGIESGP